MKKMLCLFIGAMVAVMLVASMTTMPLSASANETAAQLIAPYVDPLSLGLDPTIFNVAKGRIDCNQRNFKYNLGDHVYSADGGVVTRIEYTMVTEPGYKMTGFGVRTRFGSDLPPNAIKREVQGNLLAYQSSTRLPNSSGLANTPRNRGGMVFEKLRSSRIAQDYIPIEFMSGFVQVSTGGLGKVPITSTSGSPNFVFSCPNFKL